MSVTQAGLFAMLATGLTSCSAPPSAPLLSMSFGLKEFQFNWTAVAEADHYRLLVSPDGSAVFTQVGGNLSASVTSTTVPVAVHLYAWETSRYVLEACNIDGCTRSDEVSPMDGMLDTIGYVKASNSDVDDQFAGGSVIYGLSAAISRDGHTMAVTSIFRLWSRTATRATAALKMVRD